MESCASILSNAMRCDLCGDCGPGLDSIGDARTAIVCAGSFEAKGGASVRSRTGTVSNIVRGDEAWSNCDIVGGTKRGAVRDWILAAVGDRAPGHGRNREDGSDSAARTRSYRSGRRLGESFSTGGCGAFFLSSGSLDAVAPVEHGARNRVR